MHNEPLCGRIAPRQFQMIGDREDHYINECILPAGHTGPHIFKTPEGRYFSWEYDPDCRCDDCLYSEDPEDQCTLFEELPPKDLPQSLQGQT